MSKTLLTTLLHLMTVQQHNELMHGVKKENRRLAEENVALRRENEKLCRELCEANERLAMRDFVDEVYRGGK